MRRLAWVGGRTFASLRNHRNYRLYFVSHAVSCVLLFLIGGFYILWGSSGLASLLLAAPEHMRGRAASL